MGIGRLQPSKQVYQTSGIATPAAEVPQQFRATPKPNSPLSSGLVVPPEYMPDIRRAPVVSRVQRKVGMRYLYARGAHRQPIERLGNSVRPQPNISAFQPDDMGPIHNAGFNDALFQAGYPGFNLGLSFKVPTLPTMGGPRTNMSLGGPITVSGNRKTVKLRRSSGRTP